MIKTAGWFVVNRSAVWLLLNFKAYPYTLQYIQ